MTHTYRDCHLNAFTGTTVASPIRIVGPPTLASVRAGGRANAAEGRQPGAYPQRVAQTGAQARGAREVRVPDAKVALSS